MRRPCLSVTVKTTLTSFVVARMVVTESSEGALFGSPGFCSCASAALAAGGFAVWACCGAVAAADVEVVDVGGVGVVDCPVVLPARNSRNTNPELEINFVAKGFPLGTLYPATLLGSQACNAGPMGSLGGRSCALHGGGRRTLLGYLLFQRMQESLQFRRQGNFECEFFARSRVG